MTSSLAAYEQTIAAMFNAGEIPHPVHLEQGNEAALIRIFEHVKPLDWVLGSWRMHLKTLLHGVPPDELTQAIRSGQSIALSFPQYRVLGSAIVGGTIPIALGIALASGRRPRMYQITRTIGADLHVPAETPAAAMAFANKLAGPGGDHPTHVRELHPPTTWLFVGDMTARTGAFHEAREYAIGHDLPLEFVIENNHKSVLTDTDDAWGGPTRHPVADWVELDHGIRRAPSIKTWYYEYESHWPHAGAGHRVTF